jgi:hypothetical protein
VVAQDAEVCGVNAWAKPYVVLLCGACEVALEAEET